MLRRDETLLPDCRHQTLAAATSPSMYVCTRGAAESIFRMSPLRSAVSVGNAIFVLLNKPLWEQSACALLPSRTRCRKAINYMRSPPFLPCPPRCYVTRTRPYIRQSVPSWYVSCPRTASPCPRLRIAVRSRPYLRFPQALYIPPRDTGPTSARVKQTIMTIRSRRC